MNIRNPLLLALMQSGQVEIHTMPARSETAPAAELEFLTIEQQVEENKYFQIQKTKQDEKKEIQRRLNAPIKGNAGELTGIIPGLENVAHDDIPLFSFKA